jgi:ABC-2 type transport system permease protein
MVSDVTEGGTKVVTSWPSWLSPIGWGEQIRAYHEDNWWLLALLAVFTAGVIGLAFTLSARRDLGAGLLPSRPGPARARPGLLGPLGLAWRLQRGVFAGWAAALIVVGTAYGAVAPEVDDLVGDSEGTRDIFEQLGGGARDLTDAYLAATLAITGVAVAAYTIQASLRLRGEESGGTLEPVLAAAVAKARWLGSHVAVAVIGTLALLALTGASIGLAYGLTAGNTADELARFTGAALGQAPAALVLGGLTVAAFGLLPRHVTAVSWGAFAFCLLVGQVGELLNLPDAVRVLSPFTHLPAAPVEDVTPGPILALSAVAAALTALGAAAFRRRDVGN